MKDNTSTVTISDGSGGGRSRSNSYLPIIIYACPTQIPYTLSVSITILISNVPLFLSVSFSLSSLPPSLFLHFSLPLSVYVSNQERTEGIFMVLNM